MQVKTKDEQWVWDQIQFVRQGSFISVYRQEGAVDRLRGLIQSQSPWVSVSSQAILAEIHDQLGLYNQVEEWASDLIGNQQLRFLEEDIKHPTGDKDADRYRARARAMLILQCAVALLRRVERRTAARDLLHQTIGLIQGNEGAALRSQHIESLFHFWLGRTYSLEYDFDNAELNFRRALEVADRNLQTKLDRDRNDKDKRAAQVAAGNYVLSTCLGFGLGHLRQLEGKLTDSLRYLEVAVPLSRGSEDYHRRGFAHLLMGTALRSLGRPEEHLEEAKSLFCKREHHLHLARVNHQLALRSYDRAESGSAARPDDFRRAKTLNEEAFRESEHPSCKAFRDPVLDYGIRVVRSMIKTASQNYAAGEHHAQEAIDNQAQVPAWISGWAWLAKGRAIAERVSNRAQIEEIGKAETVFGKVLYSDKKLRDTDQAAALLYLSRLYSKIGDRHKGSIYYDRAKQFLKDAEHGWLKRLATDAKVKLGSDDGSECTFNVEDLLRENHPQGRWSYITDVITKDVRDKVLLLNRAQLMVEGGVSKVAKDLGISRATVYNWVLKSDLKEEFRARNKGLGKRE